MASLFPLLIPDIIGSVFIILDLIADIAFAVHLHRHESQVLFPITVTLIILSTIIVNVLAAYGIEELSVEMSEPEMRSLKLAWLNQNERKKIIIFSIFGIFGLLPHILSGNVYALCEVCRTQRRIRVGIWMTVNSARVGIYIWILHKNKKYGNDVTYLRLQELFKRGGAAPAVKELQSVLECGAMIYIKCFYIFLFALLYTNNWPLLLGLSFNVLSLFFGLRKDLILVSKWKFVALIVTFVNLSLRIIILLILAEGTQPWVFFIPIGCSIVLLLSWGAWLMFDAPVFPKKLDDLVKSSKPKSIAENLISSIMYTLFFVPDDFHTAISIVSFAASSIAIACISSIPLALRIAMPFAGTIGQLPSKFWWTIFSHEDDISVS